MATVGVHDPRPGFQSGGSDYFIQFSHLFEIQQTERQRRQQAEMLFPLKLANAQLENQRLETEIDLLPSKYAYEKSKMQLDLLSAQAMLDGRNLQNRQRAFDQQVATENMAQQLQLGQWLAYGLPDDGQVPGMQEGTVPAPGALLDGDPSSTAGTAVRAQVTRFGYKGDPYLDSNSAKGTGNRSNQMKAGSSVALKKSTAQKLGVTQMFDTGDGRQTEKPAGQVEVEFPDGSRQVLDVDSTIPESSGDNDRIDFYDPNGERIDIDGSQVTIRPVGGAAQPAQAATADNEGPDDGLLAPEPDGVITRLPAPAQPAQQTAQQAPAQRQAATLPKLPQVTRDFTMLRDAVFEFPEVSQSMGPGTQMRAQRRFQSLLQQPDNLQYHNLKTAQPFIDDIPDPQIRQTVAEQVAGRRSPFVNQQQAQASVEQAQKFHESQAQQQGVFTQQEEQQFAQANPEQPQLMQTIDDIVLNARNLGSVSETQIQTLSQDVRTQVMQGRPERARQVLRNAALGKSGPEREKFQADVRTAITYRELQELMEDLYFDGNMETAIVSQLAQTQGLTTEEAQEAFKAAQTAKNLEDQLKLNFPIGEKAKKELDAAEAKLEELQVTAFDENGVLRPEMRTAWLDASKQRSRVLQGIEAGILERGIEVTLPLPGANKEVPILIGGQQQAGETGQMLAELNAKAGRFVAAYIKSISGAASTDQEYKRLAALSPSSKNSGALNFTLMKALQAELVANEVSRLRPLTGDDKQAIDFLIDPVFDFDPVPNVIISGEERPGFMTLPEVTKEVGATSANSQLEGTVDAAVKAGDFIKRYFDYLGDPFSEQGKEFGDNAMRVISEKLGLE